MEEFEDFPLPQVKLALDPYIRSRQEALRIRRVLTVFLSSILTNPETSNTQLSYTLAAPDASTTIRKVPGEVTGLRHRYLRQIQAYNKAKKEYDSFLESKQQSDDLNHRPTSKKSRDEGEDQLGQDEPIGTYLSLLRLRRRYERLRIMQDYLDLISQKPPAQPLFLDMNMMLKELPPPPQPSTDLLRGSGNGDVNIFKSNTNSLMRQLEISLLRARRMLEEEKDILAECKRKRHLEGFDSNVSESYKMQALGRTRNELISWIESELSKAGRSMDGGDEQATTNGDSNDYYNPQSRAEGIKRQYQEYIDARKSLLSSLSMASFSLPIQERGLTAPNADEAGQPPMVDHPAPAHFILPYLIDHLLPLSAYQKLISLQKSSITTGLARQQRSMIQALERLSEESHLLPMYPLLAEQFRFRHAAAILASRAVDSRPSSERDISGSGGDECLKKARAWAFAADSAKANTEDAVRERMESGEDKIRMARETLDDLQEIFGLNKAEEPSEETEDVAGEDNEDIWATVAAPNVRKRRDKDQHKARHCKVKDKTEGMGLWRGLDGEVGVLNRTS